METEPVSSIAPVQTRRRAEASLAGSRWDWLARHGAVGRRYDRSVLDRLARRIRYVEAANVRLIFGIEGPWQELKPNDRPAIPDELVRLRAELDDAETIRLGALTAQ